MDTLDVAVQAVESGLAAQAKPSTDGSRQGSLDWRTPQANEAGAKVQTLFTKDGYPAKPGQRAYRKTPSGKLVLQSQTINQQVEMVSRLDSWGTPTAISRVRNEQTMAKCLKFRQSNGQTSVPIYLEEQVLKTWPTPAASTGNGGAHGLGGGSGANQTLKRFNVPEMGTGKLNPRWVETLMGLPVGWTMPSCASPATIAPMNCGSSATELFPPQQNEPSLL